MRKYIIIIENFLDVASYVITFYMTRKAGYIFMKKFIFSLFIILFLITEVFAANSPVATITAMSGTVNILSSGSWVRANINLQLYNGDKIKTGSDGLAAVRYSDGSVVKINSASTIQLVSQNTGTGLKGFINLLIGEIWVLVKPSGNEFNVVTPAATAGVEGTEFNVKAEPEGDTVLTVVKGTVNFSNNEGSIKVTESMQSSASPGQAPSPVRRVDARNVIQWSGGPVSLHSTLVALHIYYEDITEKEKALNFVKENPSLAEAILTEGKLFFDNKDFEKAGEKFQSYIKIKPDSGEAHRGLALTFVELGRLEDGMKEIDRAIEIEPDNVSYYLDRGFIYEFMNDPDKAEKIYREAIEKYPDKAAPYHSLALLQESLGRLEEAEKNCIKAVELAPDEYGYRINLANNYQFSKKYDLAIKEYKKALTLNSDPVDACNGLALVYQNLNDLKSAQEIFLEALKNHPDNILLLINLGNTYKLADQNDRAIEIFEKALRIKPDSIEASFGLGATYMNTGNYEKALEYFEKARQYDPLDALNYLAESFCYTSAGKFDIARKLLQEALKFDRTLGLVFDCLDYMAIQDGNYELLISELNKSVSLFPNWAEGHYRLACIYKDRNETDKALKFFEEALSIDPYTAESHLSFGYLYLYNYNPPKLDEAIKEFDRVISLNPGIAGAYNGLAQCYHYKGELEKALQFATKAVEMEPENFASHFSLSLIYESMGKTQEAKHEKALAEKLKKEQMEKYNIKE